MLPRQMTHQTAFLCNLHCNFLPYERVGLLYSHLQSQL